MLTHFEASKRSCHLVNLDPAAESFEYEPTIDIRDLITLEDVMEEMELGPNGGLIFLIDNLDWLEEELGDHHSHDYLLFDLPGQIELHTHTRHLHRLATFLQQQGYAVCSVYLLDSQFMTDPAKFFSGVLCAASAMVSIEVAQINVMSKMDLVKMKEHELERFLDADRSLLASTLIAQTTPKYHALTNALVDLVDNFGLVRFVPLDPTDEDSIEYVLSCVDNAMQYGEDVEPKEPQEYDAEFSQDLGGFGQM